MFVPFLPFTAHANAKQSISGVISAKVEFSKEDASTVKGWVKKTVDIQEDKLQKELEHASKKEQKEIKKRLKNLKKYNEKNYLKITPMDLPI
ncbi:hypothetical protein [Neobacillus drentensis]|uniref:hypothetical protein n=1 Tax=Neobacillus drentensis TaxID=220684 RepID=UPI002FFECB01